MKTIAELSTYVEKNHPEMGTMELFAYIDGYFDGIKDTRKDVLKTMKEGLNETRDRSGRKPCGNTP